MSSLAAETWQEANKAALADEFELIRERLQARLERAEGARGDSLGQASRARPAASIRRAVPEGFSLDRITSAFGLSTFERALLVFCAGAEMDGEVAALCGRANGDPRQTTPTFSLALALLPDPHWSALGPAAPLRRWRTLRLDGIGPLTSSPLRIDERVLHCLLGVNYLPPGLEGRLRALPLPADVPSAYEESIARVHEALVDTEGGPCVVQLQGDPRRGGRTVAAAAALRAGGVPWVLAAAGAPATVEDRVEMARLWERESALTGGLLVVELENGQRPPQAVTDLIDEISTMVLVVGDAPLLETLRVPLQVRVPRLGAEAQLQAWRRHLAPLPARTYDAVAEVVSRFDLPPEEISKVARHARRAGPVTDELLDRLHSACRAQARPALDGLAQRLEAEASWDDLVLPERPLSLLQQMVEQLRHQFTVHHRWGFAERLRQGLGVSALFTGPSGTGKTLAAQVLAAALQLDLYRIDLSAVVSKYIGETEKNLRRVFDAAETGGAVLLFDEADALFGRRGDVKDSHDRYANIEVGYLLQRMESYGGLAILTTNLKDNLDGAFLRRLRFVVEFPFPASAQRQAIWQRMFPASTPLADIDAARLAQLQLPGGNIRNIALNAAFLAASEAHPVAMRHVRRAALVECAKLERALNPSELAGWPE
jgi:hypothetical protein